MFTTNGYWEFQLVGSYANHLKPISLLGAPSNSPSKKNSKIPPPKVFDMHTQWVS